MVSLVDGETRQIDWPENTFLHAPLPGAGRDAIILLGVEPNLRWRTFCGHRHGARIVLRSRARDHARLATRRRAAHAAGSRHRERDRPGSDRAARPAGVTLRGPDRDRRRAARRVRSRRPEVGESLGGRAALRVADAVAARRQGARRPSRRAAARRRRHRASSTRPPTRTRSRSARPSAPDGETASYVEELERRVDELAAEANIPSGDALAAELTRFLRERENGTDDEDAARGQ